MAEHRGGTLKLLAKAAGGSLDPQVNYTLAVLAALPRDAGRPRHVQGRRRRRRVRDRARPRGRHPEADRGRQDLEVHAAQGHQVLQRQARARRRTCSTRSSASSRCTRPPPAGSTASSRAPTSASRRPPRAISRSRSWSTRRPTRVTFHLAQPDAEWLDKLAVPHAALLPVGHAQQGPRHEAAARHRRLHVHEVRPEPRADPGAQPALQAVVGRRAARRLRRQDHVQRSARPSRRRSRRSRTARPTGRSSRRPPTASTSSAPSTPTQVHINTQLANWYLPMNVNIPPFNNKLARQAVNYAVDRNAAVRILGGPKLAIPSCQVLPAGFPARVDYCPYTKNPGAKWSAPDLAKAKALVKQSGTAGAEGRRRRWPNDEVNKAMGVYVQSVLNSIGYKAYGQGDLRQHPLHLHPEHEEQGPDLGHAVVPGLSGAVGLPLRAARLRVVPPRQRHQRQHGRLLQQEDQRRHEEGPRAWASPIRRARSSSGRRSTTR